MPLEASVFLLKGQLTHSLHLFDDFVALCENWGLKKVLKGRFGDYRRAQDKFLLKLRSDPGGTFEEMQREDLRLGALNLAALFEITEAVMLLPYLRACNQAEVKPKLQEILTGPHLLSDEKIGRPRTSTARNYQFEITAAAKLWEAGMQPVLGEQPEIALQTAAGPIFIQCKRLLSTRMEMLIERVEEAAGQLDKNLVADPRAFGLIFVAADKILSQRGWVSPGTLKTVVDEMEQLAASYGTWEKVGERVLGICFLFRLATFFTTVDDDGPGQTVMFQTLHQYRTRVRPGLPRSGYHPALMEFDYRYEALNAKDGAEILDFMKCTVCRERADGDWVSVRDAICQWSAPLDAANFPWLDYLWGRTHL